MFGLGALGKLVSTLRTIVRKLLRIKLIPLAVLIILEIRETFVWLHGDFIDNRDS
jgi:hypothetical protein